MHHHMEIRLTITYFSFCLYLGFSSNMLHLILIHPGLCHGLFNQHPNQHPNHAMVLSFTISMSHMLLATWAETYTPSRRNASSRLEAVMAGEPERGETRESWQTHQGCMGA